MNDPLQVPPEPIECPWCHSKYAPRLYGWHERTEDGHYQHRYTVRCLNCGAQGPKKEIGPHAIDAWNNRAKDAPPVADAEGVTFQFDWDAIYHEYEWAVVERYGVYHWQVHAHLYEPHWEPKQGWISDGDYEHVYIVHDLPLGLDHRTLKQRRPHAQQETEVGDGK